MSYDEGMKLFKTANYRAAAEQFAEVTEADENNHKAWNALGICLSKIGEYEQAAVCFDNAVTLAPENATYLKNQAGNEKKRMIAEPDLELDSSPSPVQAARRQVTHRSTGSTLVKLVKYGVGGVICLFVLLIGLVFVAGMLGAVSSHPPSMTADAVMQQAQMISYEELARNPAAYKGQPVKIAGQVNQVLKAGRGVQLRVFTKDSDFAPGTYLGDDIFVDYKDPKENVIEKDVIMIYGLADGVQEYKTVLGAQRSIPRINAITHSRQ